MSYFHTGIRTIIGAESFHCPVRDGKEWDQLAMVIRLKLFADLVHARGRSGQLDSQSRILYQRCRTDVSWTIDCVYPERRLHGRRIGITCIQISSDD